MSKAGTPTEGPTNSTTTVTVGCKLPNGLIAELGRPGDAGHKRVLFRGSNAANIVGGYGITEGVDAAFYDAWAEKNKRLSFLVQGLVFKETRTDTAKAHAFDESERRNGFEAVDPEKPGIGLAPDADHLKRVREGDAERDSRAA